MTANLLQLALAVFGLAPVALALSECPRYQKWAPIVGLIGQPAFFWFALRTEAWGLIVLAVAYTLVYAWGWRMQWKARAPASHTAENAPPAPPTTPSRAKHCGWQSVCDCTDEQVRKCPHAA